MGLNILPTKDIIEKVETKMASMTDCGLSGEEVFSHVVLRLKSCKESPEPVDWVISNLVGELVLDMPNEYPGLSIRSLSEDRRVLTEAVAELYVDTNMLFAQYGLIEDALKNGAEVVQWTGYSDKDAVISVG